MVTKRTEEIKNDKIQRILGIYTKLMDGKTVNKQEIAARYNVHPRSIQRDIKDITDFLERDELNTGVFNSVIYDKNADGYRLQYENIYKLSPQQILAICKILLDSRAFVKEEMSEIIDKLIHSAVVKDDQPQVEKLIQNEEEHYVELQHKTRFLNKMWDIGQAIQNQNYIEIEYKRGDNEIKKRKLKPAAIMFSEFYFYLTAFIDDKNLCENFDVANDPFPTIYRIDRIQNLKILDEHFRVLYSSRFEEGEFRKRVQFMYGGKLQTVRFKYKGPSIEAILDRLPTAKVEKHEDGVYTVKAEVFGKGIERWIRGQGDAVEVVE
ncbi:MAG: WYL domain-containing protein [Anaerobutyricum hallii]|jgi:predicted DNA-binding transcriptional regulator YafY|uniref:helix-turn-helix transcriptional regulator n=1 Tax=Anaerobutyricum hallii TaxID=39488 RepID=UPI002E777C25|nr:WYL domain-containing protein [Anaerobutyricum hallii]MEE1484400.1 WYL domain-containing protein [Anaerobutyricum hallii]